MKFTYNDGGRTSAGYKGTANDCACRAITIATGKSYQEVYDTLNEAAGRERASKRRKGKSSARDGVYKTTIRWFMESIGWEWIPTMKIGQGCSTNWIVNAMNTDLKIWSLGAFVGLVIGIALAILFPL